MDKILMHRLLILLFLALSTTVSNGQSESRRLLRQSTKRRALVDSRHAYAFLVAGCNPSDSLSHSCIAHVYGVVVAVESLRAAGSTADIVVMVRMAADTEATTLPDEWEKLLHATGVIIKYLPKPGFDNFYSIIMDKYHVLELTDYKRVIFLDTDVMPRCSLDYVFELSEGDSAVLKENFIIATRNAPADGGFFMLEPNLDDFYQIQQIIANREKKGRLKEEIGWGHRIKAPDKWVGKTINGTKWNFYGANADQGVLYHWAKYVKKSVSIGINETIETWGVEEKVGNRQPKVPGGSPPGNVKRLDTSNILLGDGCASRKFVTGIPENCISTHPPALDYVHFCGKDKTWYAQPSGRNSKRAHDVWWSILKAALEKHGYNSYTPNSKLLPKYGHHLYKKQEFEKLKHDRATNK